MEPKSPKTPVTAMPEAELAVANAGLDDEVPVADFVGTAERVVPPLDATEVGL